MQLMKKAEKEEYYPYKKGPEYLNKLRQRFQIKRIVARVFCKYDYDYEAFKAELDRLNLNISISKVQYSHLAQSMAYKIIRAIQTFLIIQCKPNMQRLSLRKMKFTFIVLLNCRTKFEKQDVQTIFKFTKKQFQLGDTTITPEDATHLYQSLLQLVKNRASQWHNSAEDTVFKEIQQVQQKKKLSYLSSIWNQQYQQFLINNFKNRLPFVKITKAFQAKFPTEAAAFSSQSLNHQFYLVMKLIIRKVEILVKSLNDPTFPKFVKLRGRTIRGLVSPPKATFLRHEIIRLYQRDKVSREELLRIVKIINAYFNYEGKQSITPVPSEQNKLLTQIQEKSKSLQGNRLNLKNFVLFPETEILQSDDSFYLKNTVLQGQRGAFILAYLFKQPPKQATTTFQAVHQPDNFDNYSESCSQSQVSQLPNGINDNQFYYENVLNNRVDLQAKDLEIITKDFLDTFSNDLSEVKKEEFQYENDMIQEETRQEREPESTFLATLKSDQFQDLSISNLE